MHEETTRSRTGNTTPRERMPERRMQAAVCSWWAVTAYLQLAAARRTGATTPREGMPERRTKATECSWWDVTAYITKMRNEINQKRKYGNKINNRRGIAASHRKCAADKKRNERQREKQREEKPTRRENGHAKRHSALGQRLPIHAEAFD
jgi:hypothetical protein